MPILTAKVRHPKYYLVQATMKNHEYLENLFKDFNLEVETLPRTGQRLFHLSTHGNGDELIRKFSANEGDYFVWLEGTSIPTSMEVVPHDEFHKDFEVTGTYDTGLG